MQTYTCSCGHYMFFGSYGPEPCQVCEKCGTTTLRLAYGGFEPPEEHKPVVRFTSLGKKFVICDRCMMKLDIDPETVA